MSIPNSDRPLEELREAAIDHLIMNYGHGKLSREAFERRLDQAVDATQHQTLTDLTADLELQVDEKFINEKNRELGNTYERKEIPDVENIIHIFGGGNRRGQWNPAKTVRMINICGGGELDFSEATLTSNEVHVRLICICGGATIYVPEGVRVVSKVFSIFGGFGDRVPSVAEKNAPTIVIEGFILMGGAAVRIRRTLKEKLHMFANSMRNSFQTKDFEYYRSKKKYRR